MEFFSWAYVKGRRCVGMTRILVVDDDRSICKALQLGLSSGMVEVDVADNGKSAVDLGTGNRYDVIIADMILPEVDGLEVIERIRTHSPDIVSIVITGSPDRSTLTQSISQGVNAYLEKPVSIKTIKEAVGRGLREKAGSQGSRRTHLWELRSKELG
jgi:DNA-binding NtrC family response regulator